MPDEISRINNRNTANQHVFALTFDNTIAPILALDFEEAKKGYSINVVLTESSKNDFDLKTFVKDDSSPMIQNNDSLVNHEFRVFEENLDSFKSNFEIVKDDGEVIGTFEFSYENIKSVGISQGRLRFQLKNGNVIGSVSCSFLWIKPFLIEQTEGTYDDNDSQINYWSRKQQLRGGHRGAGNSFTGTLLSDIRENTMDSFKQAFERGNADFVEFDVTNTKDGVSVVYHDLGLAVDRHSTTIHRQHWEALDEACSNSPQTRVQHLSEIKGTAGDLQFEVLAPWKMPKLEEMFKNLDEKLGFNLEVKWPGVNVHNKSEEDLHEDPDWFDINEYVDKILTVVMENCGDRKLIFSCFDPNVCYCLQLKQSRYPVMQLTNGDSKHYCDQRDLRIRRTNSTAIEWSSHQGYFAINTLVKDVLDLTNLDDKNVDDKTLNDLVNKCHASGLRLFVYGDDMQDLSILNRLKESQLDALVYDCIHLENYRNN